MAIAYNTITLNTSSANATTLSVNHTASGSDRVAVVILHLMRNSTGGIAVTSATYGGNAMTQRATIEREAGGTNKTYRTYIFTYVAPPTSSTTVTCNWDVNAIASAIVVMSFTGVDQSDEFDAQATAEISGSSTPALDVVTGEANTMIVGGLMMRGGDTDPFTPDVADEKYDTETGTDTTGDIGIAGGIIAAATAGTYDFGWTAIVADGGVIAAISIRQASGALNIAPSGLAVGAAFGDATVGRGAVAITPEGLAVGAAFGDATVGRGAVAITPSGLAVAAAAGDATVTTGVVDIAPSGLAVAVGLGSASVGLVIAPSGLAVAVGLGDAAVGLGIAPSGLAAGVAIGTATVGRGAVAITPDGLAVGVVIGDAVVGTGGSVIAPEGLTVAVAAGDAVVGRGAVAITPDGLAVGVVIGDAAVSAGAVAVLPEGLAVGVVFGTAVVAGEGEGQGIAPAGLAVALVLGALAATRRAAVDVPLYVVGLDVRTWRIPADNRIYEVDD